jgi:glycosyltransferase involved in cell wall biosynthesis
MFSIYILTYNEERDIAACIESALLSDDVIVVDSCSRDRTREIAAQYPVRVIEHSFESHGKQRTWDAGEHSGQARLGLHPGGG